MRPQLRWRQVGQHQHRLGVGLVVIQRDPTFLQGGGAHDHGIAAAHHLRDEELVDHKATVQLRRQSPGVVRQRWRTVLWIKQQVVDVVKTRHVEGAGRLQPIQQLA